jgi:hypothetical protein
MKEIDPLTRDLIAYHVQHWRSLDRVIYLDGRPHPPAWAPHSWTGFSTGKWVGNTLVVTTTHLKDGYLKRSGPQTSDAYTMTEYISRYGDYLTILMIVDDPIYLAEPFIQSTTYQLDPNSQLRLEPCTTSFDENGGSDPHAVPHFLPGKNEFLAEWLERESWIPAEAARAVSVGPDGVLMVDTGPATMTDKILAAIKQLATTVAGSPRVNKCIGVSCPGMPFGWTSPFMNGVISSPAPARPLRYIFNTSMAPEHTGGKGWRPPVTIPAVEGTQAALPESETRRWLSRMKTCFNE